MVKRWTHISDEMDILWHGQGHQLHHIVGHLLFWCPSPPLNLRHRRWRRRRHLASSSPSTYSSSSSLPGSWPSSSSPSHLHAIQSGRFSVSQFKCNVRRVLVCDTSFRTSSPLSSSSLFLHSPPPLPTLDDERATLEQKMLSFYFREEEERGNKSNNRQKRGWREEKRERDMKKLD